MPRHGAAGVHEAWKINAAAPVDSYEGAEGAMVTDKGVGNRTDDARGSDPKATVQVIFEKQMSGL
jgi:hypothetical protein